MLIEQMEVGNFVDVVVDRGDYRFRLRSKVELVEKGKFYISPIMSSTRVFQFQPKDSVTIIYHAGQSMWIWEKIDAQTVLKNDQYMNMFSSRLDGKSYNRREAYRVPISEEWMFQHCIPLSQEEIQQKKREKAARKGNLELALQQYNIIDEDEDEDYRIYPFEALVKNLSETGIAFFANRDLVVGDIVKFEVQTTSGDPIVCRAEVVRIENERTTKYHKMFGCRLLQSGKGLAKHLFEVQREKLRKSRTLR